MAPASNVHCPAGASFTKATAGMQQSLPTMVLRSAIRVQKLTHAGCLA